MPGVSRPSIDPRFRRPHIPRIQRDGFSVNPFGLREEGRKEAREDEVSSLGQPVPTKEVWVATEN